MCSSPEIVKAVVPTVAVPLATTANPALSPFGIIGTPSTTVVLGGGDVTAEQRQGARLTAWGGWH